ncbi:RHS repeat-associated core domain-containing protein [uncultured Microscilla sp.]|uniref:RHS repeat domain-containing protein n=1 Tax=uncultured Microscilla sp. TaxID=432653 RepID=UPI0026198522|nr:RHS repeat-associated core domain-containing protein [uncultured Microscilla sp.]
MLTYQENYRYDASTNLLALRHTQNETTQERTQPVRTRNNRQRLYTYDEAGNQLRTDALDQLRYGADGQICYIEWQQGGYRWREDYTYLQPGVRARKITRTWNAAGVLVALEAAAYIGQIEKRTSYRGVNLSYDGDTCTGYTTQHRWTVTRIKDGHGQVGTLIKNELTGEETVTYHALNHLDSNELVVDEAGNVIRYASYLPYGDTQEVVEASDKKSSELGYSGQEQDATGLHYYGYRYLQGSSGLWNRADPIRFASGQLNLYGMLDGNPVKGRDVMGLWDYIKFNGNGNLENLDKTRENIQMLRLLQKVDEDEISKRFRGEFISALVSLFKAQKFTLNQFLGHYTEEKKLIRQKLQDYQTNVDDPYTVAIGRDLPRLFESKEEFKLRYKYKVLRNLDSSRSSHTYRNQALQELLKNDNHNTGPTIKGYKEALLRMGVDGSKNSIAKQMFKYGKEDDWDDAKGIEGEEGEKKYKTLKRWWEQMYGLAANDDLRRGSEDKDLGNFKPEFILPKSSGVIESKVLLPAYIFPLVSQKSEGETPNADNAKTFDNFGVQPYTSIDLYKDIYKEYKKLFDEAVANENKGEAFIYQPNPETARMYAKKATNYVLSIYDIAPFGKISLAFQKHKLIENNKEKLKKFPRVFQKNLNELFVQHRDNKVDGSPVYTAAYYQEEKGAGIKYYQKLSKVTKYKNWCLKYDGQTYWGIGHQVIKNMLKIKNKDKNSFKVLKKAFHKGLGDHMVNLNKFGLGDFPHMDVPTSTFVQRKYINDFVNNKKDVHSGSIHILSMQFFPKIWDRKNNKWKIRFKIMARCPGCHIGSLGANEYPFYGHKHKSKTTIHEHYEL